MATDSRPAGQYALPVDVLPAPLLRYTRIGVDLYQSGRTYAAVDWPQQSDHPSHPGRDGVTDGAGRA